MSGKAVAGLTGIIIALVTGGVAALAVVGGSLATIGCAAPIATASPDATGAQQRSWPATADWNSEQVTNAATGTVHTTRQYDARPPATPAGSSGRRATPADLGQCLSNCSPISNSNWSPNGSHGCVDGTAVLTRAAAWLTAWHGGPVPYLSSGNPDTWLNGYRRDCSGYVSMALGLPGPGLNTRELAAQSTPIPKTALRPGDLLINPSPNLRGHVVLFERWTDATRTRYLGYEQSGDGGTHHREIPYPYFGDYQMTPYQPGFVSGG